MSRRRLSVRYGTGFSGDLWTWNVRLVQAESGRVEVVWETRTFEPHAEREHRFRARSMPAWWPELSRALDAVDFSALPPSRKWNTVLDDVEQLTVELHEGDTLSSFSIFFAPEFWPAVPPATREALQNLVAVLDPLARKLHKV